jgi:hypothetical protein
MYNMKIEVSVESLDMKDGHWTLWSFTVLIFITYQVQEVCYIELKSKVIVSAAVLNWPAHLFYIHQASNGTGQTVSSEMCCLVALLPFRNLLVFIRLHISYPRWYSSLSPLWEPQISKGIGFDMHIRLQLIVQNCLNLLQESSLCPEWYICYIRYAIAYPSCLD